jgi:hypothetical protein
LTAASDPPLIRPQRSRKRKEEVTELRHRITLMLALVLGLAVVPMARAAGPVSDRAPVVVRVTSGGFSWGDAAIGAAGGSGLTLLVGGAVFGARRRAEGTERSSRCTD